jgi:putative glycosyltransferase (TIGR04348 family)
MKIGIVTPAPPKSTRGNRITAERWAKLLRALGHRVTISGNYVNQQVDLLIALHARRSHPSILRFRKEHPEKPVVLALTGTDVYRDIHRNPQAQRSLELADRIVVLQPHALRELKRAEQKKARVIYQSVKTSARVRKPRRSEENNFDVCVIGHLRPVKDSFRAAMAARGLPKHSRIRIIQIGGALSNQMAQRARRELQVNPRFEWRGEVTRARALRLLNQSRLCVISSRMEGGANVLTEAVVAGVPVLASRIAGNIGILGDHYAGLFSVGATAELRHLMLRAETDREFLRKLRRQIAKLASLFTPARERRAWKQLIGELTPGPRYGARQIQ